MKKILMALFVISVLVMSANIVMAKGPYKSLDHRQDGVSSNGTTHILEDWLGDALEIKNKNGEKFVQWFNGKQYVVHCTAGMNPDAIASKVSEGWKLWNPGPTDPRDGWCPDNEPFIYRMN